jgi:hypothetical protein
MLLHELEGLGQPEVVDVADGDLGSTTGELDGKGSADARSRSGDDGDLVGEVAHGFLSDFRYRQYPNPTVPDRPGFAPAV